MDSQTKKPIVRLYDPITLAPQNDLAVDELEKEPGFTYPTFSPDGRRIAAIANSTVYLWDLGARKLVKSWPVETGSRVSRLLFDPAGRRLAASTWRIPPELQSIRSEAISPQDYPQPKIFLIDVDADKPETIVCPHGWWGRPAFSPDGKLLAIGGAGATHLFDVGRK